MTYQVDAYEGGKVVSSSGPTPYTDPFIMKPHTVAAPQGLKSLVTDVESQASEQRWTIEVRRVPAWSKMAPLARAEDVPADVRAGLRAWLDAADGVSPA